MIHGRRLCNSLIKKELGEIPADRSSLVGKGRSCQVGEAATSERSGLRYSAGPLFEAM